ncbi:MAG: hypothetical protein HN404_17885, partial [Gemmatimonadetes bacterium]|nr:hypothetical protein [Gemmatimonadota bacterium]
TFEVGWFRDKPDHEDGHARDERSCDDYLARSLDGGLTWEWSRYSQFGGGGEYETLKEPMPFGAEGFAFKSQGERFYFTSDRGHVWSGPFRLAVWGVLGKFEARTDYMITGERSGLFYLAVEPDGTQERAFVAETSDGGLTFDLRGWIADTQPAQHQRWVMPSAVRISADHLVAAVRRKDDRALRNWIDLYDSHDNGRTWSLVRKITDTATDGEPFNGNPPSLVRLADGRLVVTYGVRAAPYRIAARSSEDDGRTWSPEITLRGGARNWDIGYPKTVVRADGMLVTVYYFATPDNRDQFIAATIWNPDILSQ